MIINNWGGNAMKKILVIGSLNMDSVIKTPHMPKSGETVMGTDISLIPGGKGANQAYAAGKLGGDVAMLGAVGKDSFGDTMLNNLRNVNVDVKGIRQLEGIPTGQAYITVDEEGQNSIIVIAGANGKVTEKMIDENMNLIDASDIIIMQLEIPVQTVQYIKETAIKKGKTVILDPAPAVEGLPDEFWNGIDYIKPNETELEILAGRTLATESELIEGAKEMLAKGVKTVLVTLGEKGCLYVSNREEKVIPTKKVHVVDTTAAGDSFTAAFALALSRDESVEDAIAFGQKVSAIAVTRKGAQTSIPSIAEL